MSDGLNMQERVREPESELEPGVGAVKSKRSPPVRFLVNATGVVDTSISGGIVMLQQPPRWSHDFDPDTNESRASLPSVIPVFDNPPATTTPPEGSSDLTVATTEFVDRACNAAVIRAVMESKHGSDGRFPAAPGDIGEVVTVQIPPPGQELQTATITTVAVLELPPGDWDVYAMGGFGTSGLNPPTCDFVVSIADTASFPGFTGGATMAISCVPTAVGNVNLPVFKRVLSGAPITLFLMVYSAFSGTARVFGYGYMTARRAR